MLDIFSSEISRGWLYADFDKSAEKAPVFDVGEKLVRGVEKEGIKAAA